MSSQSSQSSPRAGPGRGSARAARSNLRAITLGLEKLRRLDEYGITARGQQYAGFRELGSGGTPLASGMTVREAVDVLLDGAGATNSPVYAGLQDLDRVTARMRSAEASA